MAGDGRVAGSVELRPLRLGLVIRPDTRTSLMRAIELASLCWGGSAFPIFTADEDPEHIKRISILLGVDALIACDEDPRATELADANGFAWLGFRKPPVIGEHADRLVDLRTVLAAKRRGGQASFDSPALACWSENDPLATLFSVIWGQLADTTEYEGEVLAEVAATLQTIEIPDNAPLPESLHVNDGPLALGLWEVFHQSVLRGSGFVVIDPSSVADLVMYWNLRAVGNLVLPWPATFDGRIAEFSTRLLADLPRQHWGPDSAPRLSIFASDRHIPKELASILPDDGSDVIVSPHDLYTYVHFGSQLTTNFRSYFDVPVSAGPGSAASIRVPLPRNDLVPPRPGETASDIGWQYCAARIEINSERDLGERMSFRAPAIRGLVPTIRWTVASIAPVVRGIGDGVVVASRIDDEDLTLGALDSTILISHVLTQAGFDVRFGDASRWTARIVDLLGGAASSLASQPAVREVLDLAARERGANAQELRNAARQNHAPWAEHSRLWLRSTPYEQWVVGVLAARNIIEAYLRYVCPACGLSQAVDADRVQHSLRCDDCEHETPLSLQVLSGATWRLKTRRLLNQRRLRASLPLASTVHLLQQLGRDDGALHYALGVELTVDGRTFEIDYAALVHDDLGPALVVGEGKAHNNIDDNDIANLETVQDAVRKLGMECFLAISTSKDNLGDAEITRLRQAAERFLVGLAEPRGRAEYRTMPLVLTKQSLTTPELHDDHPLRASNGHRRSLATLAHWTCERELGLTGEDWPSRTLHWKA